MGLADGQIAGEVAGKVGHQALGQGNRFGVTKAIGILREVECAEMTESLCPVLAGRAADHRNIRHVGARVTADREPDSTVYFGTIKVRDIDQVVRVIARRIADRRQSFIKIKMHVERNQLDRVGFVQTGCFQEV